MKATGRNRDTNAEKLEKLSGLQIATSTGTLVEKFGRLQNCSINRSASCKGETPTQRSLNTALDAVPVRVGVSCSLNMALEAVPVRVGVFSSLNMALGAVPVKIGVSCSLYVAFGRTSSRM